MRDSEENVVKAILISIKPKWVAKILNGEKTLEIRKTMPKCELPIDVYIYCTKKLSQRFLIKKGEQIGIKENGEDIIADTNIITKYPTMFEFNFGGKVVAKFTLNKVEEIEPFEEYNSLFGLAYKLTEKGIINCQKAQLTYEEYNHYLKGKRGYAWHIDNLVVFDKPKELNEFYVYSHSVAGVGLDGKDKTFEILKPLTKAPQSYCFIRDVL